MVGLVVEAGHYYRSHRNTIGFSNVAVPTSGYVPLAVTEVSSGRQVTVYNQDPLTLGKIDNPTRINRLSTAPITAWMTLTKR